jgi:hypothetical protein
MDSKIFIQLLLYLPRITQIFPLSLRRYFYRGRRVRNHFCLLTQLYIVLNFARILSLPHNLRFYPLSRHTWGSVETWGQGPKITEYPSSIII